MINDAGMVEVGGDGGRGGDILVSAVLRDWSLELKYDATDCGENESVCGGRDSGGSP